MSSEKMPKAQYPPDVRLVEKTVKTIEGYSDSLVKSLELDQIEKAKRDEETQRTQAYWRQQYENQVMLNEQMTEQRKMLEAAQADYDKVRHEIERLNVEMAERPRASSLARWGIFNEKGDHDMEREAQSETREPLPMYLSAGADMPIPPVYKGFTQNHKREFMDSYLIYARKVQFINESTSVKVVRMPVGACIDHKTAVRICRYEFKLTEEKVTEDMWKKYFLDASAPDLTRLTTLDRELANLKMMEDADGNSRVDKLLHDFLRVLDENNMESYDVHEPKLCIQHLVNAIRPFALRQTIRSSLKSQHAKRFREDLQEFVGWLRPQVVSFSLFEAGLKKSEEFKAKKQKGADGKNSGGKQGSGASGSSGPAGSGKPSGTQNPHKSNGGKTSGEQSGGNKKGQTQRRCLKCNSPDHSVFNCSEATQDEAKRLWEAFKKNGMKQTIGGVTQLQKPQEDSVLLDAECGTASVKVLTDFGASESVISSKCVKSLTSGDGTLRVRKLNTPVIAVGFSGELVTIYEEAVLTLKVPTRAGVLMLTNVKCWILPVDLPDGMGDLLLSRKVMQKLGYNPHQLMENARKHYAVLDAADLTGSDVVPSASVTSCIGAISEMETSFTQSTEEEGLEEGVSQQFTPIWSQDQSQDREAVRAILREKVEAAKHEGCPDNVAADLLSLLLEFEDCFRVELGRDPPVDVDPLEVRVKEGAEAVKCKARRYSPEQRKFLKKHVAELESAGLVFKNLASRWASPPLIVAKPNGEFRMTVDVRMVNDRTDRLVWPMPMLETILEKVRGSMVFFTLDFFKGYWQLPLAKNSQELFSFITDEGVYTPTRVLMGGSDSVAYCQASVQEMFEELLYEGLLIWLDDLLGHVKDPLEIVPLLRRVLIICRARGLKLNPKKCAFWLKEALWCGRLINGEGVQHNPDRVSALTNLPAPKTGGDLQQFICAVNWMRTSIPGFNKLIKPLQDLMEKVCEQAGGRTKRKVAKVLLSDLGWNDVHQDCLDDLKGALKHMTMLHHPDPEKQLCVYTDASESHWGAMVSQVPVDQVDRPVGSQEHEPLMFLSGTFSGAAKHWAIVEKEAFAILETCKRADFLLRREGGFHLFTDHRNLQYIFNPTSVVSTVPKYTAEKLQRWSIVLMSYAYVIRHIPGEENVWADLLSRWGSPLTSVCALVSLQPQSSPLLSDDFVWPTTSDIRCAQSVASKKNVTWSQDLWKGGDGLFYTANDQMVIPEDDEKLKIRLLVVAHFSVGGHRGVQTTTEIIKKSFWWSTIEEDVKMFIQKCLHCASASSGWIQRPLGEALHAEKPNELIHFDYLYMGKSEDGYEYLLVIKDDASKFVWLLLAKTADSSFVADALLQWFASFGVCQSWVSDQGTHFKNQVIEDLQRVLGANHHFTTARCPWANGTVERVMREVLRCARVLLSEWRLPTNKWDKVVSLIQLVLNQSPLSSLGGEAPVTCFTGMKPMHPVERVVARDVEVKSMTLEELQQNQKFNLSKLQEAMEDLHKKVKDKAAATRMAAKKKGPAKMANFEIGDYVLYADVWTESKDKLLTKWNGPAVVTKTVSQWVYVIKNLVTGEEKEAHASRLKFYADNSLELTGDFLAMVAHNSEGHVVSSIKDFRFNKQNKQHEFLVSWRGLSDAEDTWEPSQQLFEDVPALVRRYCASLCPSTESKSLVDSFKGKLSLEGSVVPGTLDLDVQVETMDVHSSSVKKPKIPVKKIKNKVRRAKRR